jgi:hypothetical protein
MNPYPLVAGKFIVPPHVEELIVETGVEDG